MKSRNEDLISVLTQIYGALIQIDVKGKRNLSNLLGAINLIEKIIEKANESDKHELKKEEDNEDK